MIIIKTNTSFIRTRCRKDVKNIYNFTGKKHLIPLCQKSISNNYNEPYLFKLFIKITLFFLSLLLILSLTQCNSFKNKIFPNINKYQRSSKNGLNSKEKIDKEKSYEVYFMLTKKEDCLKFQIISKIVNLSINSLSTKIMPTFFIVERAININGFKGIKDKKIVFSEIGRNFDAIWKWKNEIVICSSKKDPLKKLHIGLYRIRFSIFNKNNFDYEITVFSNNKISFLDKSPNPK